MCEDRRRDFRERLLGAEPMSPVLRERYEKEVRAMMEEKLTGVKKWFYVVFAVLASVAAVFAACVAMGNDHPPLFPRLVWMVLAVGAAVKGAMLTWIIWQGSLNWRTNLTAYVRFHWWFALILMILLTMFGLERPPSEAACMILIGLFIVLVSGFAGIRVLVERTQLNTREKLLEIELRLADLSEQMTRSDRG